MANFAEAGIKFIAQGINTFVSSIERADKASSRFNASISAVARNANRSITRIGSVAGVTDTVEEKLEASRARALQTSQAFERLGDQANILTTKRLVALVAGLGAVTLALGFVFKAGLETAVSFENAFAGVTKTVDVFVDRAETAATGIVKLTEAGQEFREELVGLSTEIPVAFEELSEIAGLGGQLGIIEGLAGDEAQASLLTFTETVAGLAEATDLTQEKAAIGLAQISNIFRESVDDVGLNVERLGSVLVELGNTSAATERLILNFSQRIAGAGQTVGLTQAEVMGIGTAFASIGITAEAGSTAVNRALLIINEAVADSTDKFTDNTTAIANTIEAISDLQADLVRLEAQTGISGESLTAQRDAWLEAGNAAENFGRQLGDARRENLFQTQTEIDRLTQKLNTLRIAQGSALTTEVFDELLRVVQLTAKGADQTAESFKELFREDPAEAFALFVEGLAQEGDAAGATLDRIGLGSVEATRAFLAMAGASDLVRDRIMAANAEFERNMALTEEVSIRYATLRSNAIELWNALRALGDNIFGILIPLLNPLVEWGKEVIGIFQDELPGIIQAFVDRVVPEVAEAFNTLFGDDLFPGREITTPEGFVISGELIGAESPQLQGLRETLQGLRTDIEAADFSTLGDSIVNFWNTTSAIWLAFTENLDLIVSGIEALITVLGATFFISAMKKAGEAVLFLSSPLGQLAVVVFGLSIAWQNDWLNIQQATEDTVSNITTSLGNFKTTLEGLDLGINFSGLVGGTEQELDGTTVSGSLIGIEPTLLQEIGTSAEMAVEGLGKLVTLIVDTPLDQIAGFVTLIDGLAQALINLPKVLAPDPVFAISDLIIDDRLQTQALILEGLEQAAQGARAVFVAPIMNLAELIGIDEDVSAVVDAIALGLQSAGQRLFTGFMSQFAGADFEGLDLSIAGLFTALGNLADSEFVTTVAKQLRDMGAAFAALGTALGRILGDIDAGKLLEIAGAITGFLVITGIDTLTNLVTALTGLVVVLEGLLVLDLETISEGLEILGTSLLNFIITPFQNIGEQFDFNFRQQIIEPIPGLVLEAGQAFADSMESLVPSITEAINKIISLIQSIFLFEIEAPNLFQFFLDLEAAVSFTISDIQTRINNMLLGIEFEIEAPNLFQFFLNLEAAVSFTISDIQTRINNMLLGIEIEPPSFTSLVNLAITTKDLIVSAFQSMFDGITISLPDFGITEALIDLGLVEDPDTAEIAEGLATGIVQGIEHEEELWRSTWFDFLLSPIEASKEALGIESASTVTQEMGQDLVLGLALGLSDLTPLEEALIGVNSSILSAFTNLATNLTDSVGPALESTDRMFINLYSDTLPRTTSSIIDELIPAKEDLVEVNNLDLIPSVEQLIDVEDRLERQFRATKDALDRLIDTKRRAKDRAKDLGKEIDLLAESYLALAAAIGAAKDAGPAGLSSPSVPSVGPVGPEFQSGGSFIVPEGIGPQGMPIRVHAGELVQIIPAQFVEAMTALPMNIPGIVSSPAVSGATINNLVSSTSTSEVKEFHLHVTESPTYDVRDSFELLEALT